MKCFVSSIAGVFLLSALSSSLAFGQAGMMGPGGIASFIGYEGHEINQNVVLPQVAVGEHYTTRLMLLNMGNTQQMNWVTPQNLKTTGRMYFYREDGTRLQVSVNGAAPASEFAFSLDPSQAAYYTLGSTGADTPGWALITVDDIPGSTWGMMDGLQMSRGARIMATVFYTYEDGSPTISRVGVMPSMYEMGQFKNLLMAVQARDDVYTGVAIVNTSAVAVNVQLRLRDGSGNVLATTQLSLGAGNQIAKFAAQLFGSAMPSGTQGIMEISTADEGVVALGLLESQGIMTSVPVMHYGQITMMP